MRSVFSAMSNTNDRSDGEYEGLGFRAGLRRGGRARTTCWKQANADRTQRIGARRRQSTLVSRGICGPQDSRRQGRPPPPNRIMPRTHAWTLRAKIEQFVQAGHLSRGASAGRGTLVRAGCPLPIRYSVLAFRCAGWPLLPCHRDPGCLRVAAMPCPPCQRSPCHPAYSSLAGIYKLVKRLGAE
jgi:hypothetical protein